MVDLACYPRLVDLFLRWALNGDRVARQLPFLPDQVYAGCLAAAGFCRFGTTVLFGCRDLPLGSGSLARRH